MSLSRLALFALAAGVAACSSSESSKPDPAEPVTGRRYLGFQIFEGTADPAIPFDRVVEYTPADKIAKVVDEILEKVGARGGDPTRLAFVLGPIAFDHDDDEARRIIDDGFAIARDKNIAVGFHLDDSMFWSKRDDLFGDPDNVEWTDWDGTPSEGLLLDWAHPPARMCFNAPGIRAEVRRRARDVIGAEIAAQLKALPERDRVLFAGVIAGWETHVGQDVSTMDRLGFHALANRGFSASKQPSDAPGEAAATVHDFISLWTEGLVAGGVDPKWVFTHVAFLSRTQFDALRDGGMVPPGTTYDDVVNFASSTADPSVAFVDDARPGFTTYPGDGVFDQIRSEVDSHGMPGWASSEGANLLPGAAVAKSGLTMDEYLARSFDHGAALVNVFGWGIGTATSPSPFSTDAKSDASIAAYRRLLNPSAGGR